MKKILIILSISLFISCSKNDDETMETTQVDKVIFGSVYGMCGGDCRDLFLINNFDLYKDADTITDGYGDWAKTTFIDKLDLNKYQSIKNLLNVPADLFQKELAEKTLVQSWADVDYYLYIEKDGKSKELIFDHIHKNADPEIKAYFQSFLRSYKEVGGHIIDSTGIEKYY